MRRLHRFGYVTDGSSLIAAFAQGLRPLLLPLAQERWCCRPLLCPASSEADGEDRTGWYYYNFNSGLQAQSPIYRVKKDSLAPPSESAPSSPQGSLFFDPNLLSEDGTASLGGMVWSDSGEYVVYAVSRSGSDWMTVYVRRSDRPHAKSAEDGGEKGVDDGRLDECVYRLCDCCSGGST